MWDSSTAWRLVEGLRIGSVEGPGPDVFGELLDLEVDATGSTYALDGQAQQIQVLDARGAHVGTIGRPRRWTR